MNTKWKAAVLKSGMLITSFVTSVCTVTEPVKTIHEGTGDDGENQ